MKMKTFIALGLLLAGVANAQVNTQYGQQAANSEQYNAYISAFGYQAMYATNYGYGSSAFGANALRVSSGFYNTAVGFDSMVDGTSGSYNTALGTNSLAELGSGNNNVAIGYSAGSCATVNGSSNIWISHCGLAKDNNVIRIGTQGTQKFTQIAGIYESKVIGGRAVVVDAKGHLGYAVTKVVPNVASAPSAEDIVSLRTEIAGLRTQLNAVKAQIAARGIK
jgi:hypothetical protein